MLPLNTQRRRESTGNEFPERVTLATLLLISFLPSRLAFALGRQVGALRFWWMGYRHPREIGTLVMYMSNRLRVTDDRSVAALRRSFELITIQDLEGWFLPRLTKDNAARLITFEGVDNLNAALRGGRGAVLFSGHTMSMMIVLVGLKLLGYGVTAIRSGRKTVDARSLAEWFGRRQFLLME